MRINKQGCVCGLVLSRLVWYCMVGSESSRTRDRDPGGRRELISALRNMVQEKSWKQNSQHVIFDFGFKSLLPFRYRSTELPRTLQYAAISFHSSFISRWPNRNMCSSNPINEANQKRRRSEVESQVFVTNRQAPSGAEFILEET
jgi:hypothetical protein